MSAVLVTGLTEAVSEHALREFFSYRRVCSACPRAVHANAARHTPGGLARPAAPPAALTRRGACAAAR